MVCTRGIHSGTRRVQTGQLGSGVKPSAPPLPDEASSMTATYKSSTLNPMRASFRSVSRCARHHPKLPQSAQPARMSSIRTQSTQADAPLTVMVASKNMVKINAARIAVENCLSHRKPTVLGTEAASGVPDQPWGDDQTLQGARNRAAALMAQHPSSLIVAIEGGVGYAAGHRHTQQGSTKTSHRDDTPHHDQDTSAPGGVALECFAWVVVRSSTGAESVARSGSFLLPPAVCDLVLQGVELGAADDQVFKRVKSGQGSGTVGFLSHGLITRQAYYEHTVMLALLPFMNPQHYGQMYELGG